MYNNQKETQYGTITGYFLGDGDDFTEDLKSQNVSGPLFAYWESSYTAAQIENGKADSFLKLWATEMKAYGQPIIFAPLDEMNGNWNPYFGDPAAFKAAWIRIHGFFTGDTNVKFAYDPNVATPGTYLSTANFLDYYPGSAYVDIVGLDGFDFGNGGGNVSQTFAQVFDASFATMQTLDKPFWITSTGVVNTDNQSAFITAAFAAVKTYNLAGIVYFNYDVPANFVLGTAALATLKSSLFTTLGTPQASHVGVFRFGYFWLLDVDGNQQFNSPPDLAFPFGGVPGDIPIVGDWNGNGHTKVGIYRPGNGLFILDSNGNGVFDSGDAVYDLGVGTQPGDIPMVGDWNGDGRSKVGLFRQGFFWILDYNGNGVFEQGIDTTYAFGGVSGDVPVVGDWTGAGTSNVGIVRYGYFWILDANGNGTFDGTGPGQDYAFAYGGIPGDVPVVGDWNGSGTSKVGVFRFGYFWVLDANGNHQFDGTGPGQDLAFPFGGIPGDKPVVGKW